MEKKFITCVKLKDGGMKGLEVNFVKEEMKDGKVWLNDYWTGRKTPVGSDLMDVIKAFRYYLLDIYGYAMEDINVADCNVVEINFSGGVGINGEYKVLNGVRSVKLKTGLIDSEHEYEKMDELQKLVGQLKEEVEKYLEGKSVMSESQLVMQFYKKKGKFDEAEFEGMSEEEKKLKATKILEEMGSIVIHNDDMSVGVQEQVETVDIKPKEDNGAEAISAEATMKQLHNFGAQAQPNFETTVEEVKSPIVFEEGEEDFALAITPVKVG